MTTTPDTRPWQIKRLAAALGAEIHGVDLNHPSQELADTLEALLLEHQVLFFPNNISASMPTLRSASSLVP